MKAKRLIALALAAVFMLSAAATPVFAAVALPQENAALEQQNDMVSIRLKATGDLVYGSNYKLEVQTNPADTLGDRAEPAADRRRGRAERLRHNARGVVEKPRRRPHRGQHAQHHRDQRRRGEDPDAVFGKEFFHVVGSSVQ